jgi:ATP-dependent DNA helicase RecQ
MGILWPPSTPSLVVEQALRHLRREHDTIEPRKQIPCPLQVEVDLRTGGLEVGRCLTRWGDPGLAQLVRSGKYVDGRFADELVDATRTMLIEWAPDPVPTWVTWVPSRSSNVVGDFARRLGDSLGLDAVPAIVRIADKPPQKAMQNSCQQARNVAGSFAVDGARGGPVFLVDDMVDSRWTFTILGGLLRAAGAGPVYPVALSNTSNRSE